MPTTAGLLLRAGGAPWSPPWMIRVSPSGSILRMVRTCPTVSATRAAP